MGMEIERKFLLNLEVFCAAYPTASGQSFDLNKMDSCMCFSQGYLSRKPSVRVRVTEGGHWRRSAYGREDLRVGEAWLTVKGPGKIERAEFEYEIPHADGMALLEMCAFKLTKTRYTVEVAGKVWEIDEFHSSLSGLWLAEIELDSADEEVKLPLWAGREVSVDPRYTNASLAEHGLPTDPK